MTNASSDCPVQSLHTETTDVLVLGSGIAGYQAANAAAKNGVSVSIVGLAKGASPYVLGFNAALENGTSNDSIAQYYNDTFLGGYEIGDPALIQTLTQEARVAFAELQALGVPFETNAESPAFRHLSGSRYPRSVYVKAGTGNAILAAISKTALHSGVKEYLGLRIVSLIKVDERVCGALAFNRHSGALTAFLAANVVLATGGIGGLYGDSTYPADISGDSYALALDVGATLIDMEFVQFEPTVVSTPLKVRGMEMPTAMLGDGAILTNVQGERFMRRYNFPNYEKQIEKAKLALYIQKEIDEGRGTENGSVYFDARGLTRDCLQGYVTHYRRLINAGVDPAVTPVQIHPAAHSLMGGVKIDGQCHSGIDGLFVCGEAAGGVHGASRIAGNGASDVIVFGRVAGKHARRTLIPLSLAQINRANEQAAEYFALAKQSRLPFDTQAYSLEIQQIMASKVGIRRCGADIKEAIGSLQSILSKVENTWDGSPVNALAKGRSAALVGLAIALSALRREESRGAHFRTDFPDLDNEQWKRSNRVKLDQHKGLLVS